MDSSNGTDNLLIASVCAVKNKRVCVLIYMFLSMLTVVTIVGNLLVITSIMYFKQLRTSSNCFILSLAAADLLVGAVLCPIYMVNSYEYCFYVHSLLCKLQGTLDFVLSVSSILNLSCISVDRYFAVCHPLLYKSKITDHVAIMMCLGSWVAAFLLGIVFFGMIYVYNSCYGVCYAVVLLITIFAFYVPVGLLFLIYIKILLVAQKQENRIENTTSQTGTVSSKESKATKTMATIMGLFLLCWLPVFLTYPFQNLNYVLLTLAEPFNWFALSNSMFNPFIYAFFYRWFRSAVRLIISGKIFQGNLYNTKLG